MWRREDSAGPPSCREVPGPARRGSPRFRRDRWPSARACVAPPGTPAAAGACPRTPTPRRGFRGQRRPPSALRASSRGPTFPSVQGKPSRAVVLFDGSFRGDPVGLVRLDLIYQLDVFRLRQQLATVLLVFALGEQLAGHAIGLVGKLADVTVELQVWHVEVRLARSDVLVDLPDQLLALLVEERAAVLVHMLEVRFLLGLRLVVAALEAPDIEPVRRARAVHAEQVIAHWHPLVDELLHDRERHHAGLDDSLHAVLPGAQVEGFLLEHGDHGLRQRRKAGVAEHSELELSVAIDEICVGEEVEPVIDILVEGTEQAPLLERAPLEHLLRFDAPAVTEMVDQQVAHLPAVAHLLCHNAAERLPVVLRGSGLKQPPLLLDRSKLRVPLIDDQVEQRVAHALVWNLDHPLPFWPTLEGAEL